MGHQFRMQMKFRFGAHILYETSKFYGDPQVWSFHRTLSVKVYCRNITSNTPKPPTNNGRILVHTLHMLRVADEIPRQNRI